MTTHLEGARSSCALHGALATIQAIEGFVPVIHSTSGCGMQHHLGVTRACGAAAGWDGGPPVSSTNIGEKHVVFGGGSRLREQIKNTAKVVRGDLYVVVSGCATEMVGDDIPAMTKEAREQGIPVVFATTPGFRGDVHHGYLLAVKGLIEQLPAMAPPPEGKVPGLVNVWGIIPQQDPFWYGHLREVGRLLARLGLEANLLFGQGEGLAAWQRVPAAELNLVVSPWGIEPARLLEEKYGTPWLDVKGLPVGAAGTGELLVNVGERLGLEPGVAEAAARAGETELAYALARSADTYFNGHFQREFSLVAETAVALGLSGFLIRTLGLIPRTIIITDNPPPAAREEASARLQRLAAGLDAAVVFSEDRGEIADLLRASNAELVIGSALEREAAQALQAPLVEVAFPLEGRLVLERGYAGYGGAIAFLEELGSAILAGRPVQRAA